MKQHGGEGSGWEGEEKPPEHDAQAITGAKVLHKARGPFRVSSLVGGDFMVSDVRCL